MHDHEDIFIRVTTTHETFTPNSKYTSVSNKHLMENVLSLYLYIKCIPKDIKFILVELKQNKSKQEIRLIMFSLIV